jgi:hypothetical protein
MRFFNHAFLNSPHLICVNRGVRGWCITIGQLSFFGLALWFWLAHTFAVVEFDSEKQKK